MASIFYFDRLGNYLGTTSTTYVNPPASIVKWLTPASKPLVTSGGAFNLNVALYNQPNSVYYTYRNDIGLPSTSPFYRSRWGHIYLKGEDDPSFKEPSSFPSQANLYIANIGSSSGGVPTTPTTSGGLPAPGTGGVSPPNTFDNNPAYHRLLKLTAPQMQGADVRAVQAKLGVNQDGVFGSGTKAAVIAFQKRVGITADGIVGPCTAYKLGMAGGTPCGGAPAPSGGGGTGTGGGGGTPTPTPPPQPPPPPPKPQPPYKLPQYQPPETVDLSMLPYTLSDMAMATYDIFNAYELALISNNRYFETIQPSYSVISNMISTLKSIDPDRLLVDSLLIDKTLADNIFNVLQTYAYGVLKPSNISSNKRIYSANRASGPDPILNRRTISAKFISDDTLLDIGQSKYKVSIIRRRMGDTSSASMSFPVSIQAIPTSPNAVSLTWNTAPGITKFVLTQYVTNNNTSSTETTLFGSTTSWNSGNIYIPQTQQCYKLQAYSNIYTADGQQLELLVGEDTECVMTPALPPPPPPDPKPQLARWTASQAINGQWYTRWLPPADTSNFAGVHIVVNSNNYPAGTNDGTIIQRTAAQVGQETILLNIGIGDRPRQTKYARMWSYNSQGAFSTDNTPIEITFLENPVEVMPSGRQSWQIAYNKWETCCGYSGQNCLPGYSPCGRVRASNYGANSNYVGMWWYDNRLRDALGGRNCTSIDLEIHRADGGDGGPIPAYIGNHDYLTRPGGQPTINNIQTTPAVARWTGAWVNMNRFNGVATAGGLVGFGMYKVQSSTNDLHAWVGDHTVATDGRIHIRHSDYGSY